MRASGILMPVFSLPGPFGIGTLGSEATAFVDFLAEAKQTYWQILPIGPTGYGDSPYQSFSAFAGNPYFIDFRLLAADGYLTAEELPAAQPVDSRLLIDVRQLSKIYHEGKETRCAPSIIFPCRCPGGSSCASLGSQARGNRRS